MSKCIYDLSEDCHNKDCLNCVLDKIRAEIEHWESDDTQDDYQIGAMDMQKYVLRVIDKYRGAE